MKIETTRGLARVVLVGFWTWFVLTVFFGAIPDSPMRLSKKNHMQLMSVIPEGWSFFTRNPREDHTFVYQRTEAGWEQLNQRVASRHSWFGLNRRIRSQGVELGGLLARVAEEDWTRHDDPFAFDAVLDSIPRIEAPNSSHTETMCGELLIEKKAPVPWAWSGSKRQVRMKAKYVRVAADCDAEPMKIDLSGMGRMFPAPPPGNDTDTETETETESTQPTTEE